MKRICSNESEINNEAKNYWIEFGIQEKTKYFGQVFIFYAWMICYADFHNATALIKDED